MMDSIDIHEALDEIKYILDRRESNPEPPYWIINHPEHDESVSFCWDCLQRIIPAGKVGIDWGGGYCPEEDGGEHCEKCGKLLQYTLTDYGVDYELEHYAEYPPENLDNPDECYHLARIAYGLCSDEQKALFLSIIPEQRTATGAEGAE